MSYYEECGQSSEITQDGVTRTRTFKVKAVSITAAETEPGISLWDNHPLDGSVYCDSISTQQVEGDIYEVRFNYKNPEQDDKEDIGCEQNPLMCAPIASWSSSVEEEIFKKDLNDDDVVNSLNEQLDPLPQIRRSRMCLVVEYNSATQPDFSINDKTNNSAYMGAAKDCLIATVESAVRTWHKDIGFYYKNKIKLDYNPKKWTPMKIINTSINEWAPTTDACPLGKIRIMDGQVPASKPQPIDKVTNYALARTDPVDWLEFPCYESIDYDKTFGTPT